MNKDNGNGISEFVNEILKNKIFAEFVRKNKKDKTLKDFLKLSSPDIEMKLPDENKLDEKDLDDISGGKKLYDDKVALFFVLDWSILGHGKNSRKRQGH